MTYELRYWPALVLLLSAWLFFFALILIASLASGDGPPLPVAVLWLAIMAACLYQFLFKVAYRLVVESDWLVWKSLLRSGRIPLPQLRRVRTRTDIAYFEAVRGRPVVIPVSSGFSNFVQSLREREPNVEVRVGRWARLAEWSPKTTFRALRSRVRLNHLGLPKSDSSNPPPPN